MMRGGFFLLFYTLLCIDCGFLRINHLGNGFTAAIPLDSENADKILKQGGKPRVSRDVRCGDSQLFYKKTGQCFTVGTQGPCGENMIFYPSQEDAVGRCDCRINNERAYIFHLKSQKCYKIFTQGPCVSGSWLVLDDNKNPACKNNDLCIYNMLYVPFSNGTQRDWIPLNDECVELFQLSDQCPNGGRVALANNGTEPTCVAGDSVRPLSIGTVLSNSPKCPENYVWKANECAPITLFDFPTDED